MYSYGKKQNYDNPEVDVIVKAVEDRLEDAVNQYKSAAEELGVRLKDIEQNLVGGYPGGSGVSTFRDSSRFASDVFSNESFKNFFDGQQRNCKLTLEHSLLETKNTITGDAGSPAEPSNVIVQPQRMPGIVAGAFRNINVLDLMPRLPSTSNMVEITREAAFTNNAAAQAAEGDTKAQSDLTFELIESRMVTYAHWLKVSKQSIEDAPALARFIEARLKYGVMLKVQADVINGTGASGSLDGLINNATAYSLADTGDTLVDTLSRAAEQLDRADWMPTGFVLHPADWRAITRVKDAESRYLMAGPAGTPIPAVWGIPVALSNSMAQGQFLVADFDQAAILWDRQQATVEFYEQDGDNVQRNLWTVLGEGRYGLSVIRPAAIIHGSF